MSVGRIALGTCALWLVPACAQMMQMNHTGMYMMNMASGTSMNPQSWPMPMLMRRLDSWNLMFMGQAFLVDTQQSGPRGGDKFYSANWFMASAEHRVGERKLPAADDAQPGPGDHHGPALSGVVPDRRDGVRQAARRRAASAQSDHGPGRALRASVRRRRNAAVLLRAGGRSGAGTRWRFRIALRRSNCRRRR